MEIDSLIAPEASRELPELSRADRGSSEAANGPKRWPVRLTDERDLTGPLIWLTPDGAPALRCQVPQQINPCPLLLVKPYDIGPRLAGRDWLTVMLEAMSVKGSDGRPIRVAKPERVAAYLAPGHRRWSQPESGLPALPAWQHTPNGWNRVAGLPHHRERHGRPVRDILAAAALDLHGLKPTWITRWIVRGNVGVSSDLTGEPLRNTQRYVTRGRSILFTLGVWPWVHAADEGKLPKTWRTEAIYAESLSAWRDARLRDFDAAREDVARLAIVPSS